MSEALLFDVETERLVGGCGEFGENRQGLNVIDEKTHTHTQGRRWSRIRLDSEYFVMVPPFVMGKTIVVNRGNIVMNQPL